MIYPQQDPGHWLTFSKRRDNVDLPINELTRKYNKEKLLFENYVTNFKSYQLASLSQKALGVGGGNSFITDRNFYQVIDLWFSNQELAEQRYGTIENWDVSRVTDMGSSFEPSNEFTTGKNVVDGFNQDLSKWDVSSVTNMQEMFSNQTAFNQPLDSWNVGNGENFLYMFSGATVFNQSLNSWNMINATRISLMFYEATAFNGNISDWNVSNVFDFSSMFEGATSFDQNISSWDIKNSANDPDLPGFGLTGMFRNATSFNQNISSWVIPNNIITMFAMFENATSFDQNLSSWNITSLVSGTGGATDMFKGITLSTANYSALLIGWAAQTNTNGVTLNGGNSQYSAGAAADARAQMQGQSWVITDGGQA